MKTNIAKSPIRRNRKGSTSRQEEQRRIFTTIRLLHQNIVGTVEERGDGFIRCKYPPCVKPPKKRKEMRK